MPSVSNVLQLYIMQLFQIIYIHSTQKIHVIHEM